jgi:hypothetical protein
MICDHGKKLDYCTICKGLAYSLGIYWLVHICSDFSIEKHATG